MDFNNELGNGTDFWLMSCAGRGCGRPVFCSLPLPSGAATSQAHCYDFVQADDFGGTVAVVVSDRAGNETTESFVVVNNTVAPTAVITVPERAGLSFVVVWSGSDDAAGIREYEVQVKEGEGDWTDWLTGTTAMKATFAGMQGISYTFRVKATDNVNNPGEWVESEAVEISDMVTKYYQFGGQRVAMRRGAEVYFIHGDHLGSTSLTTDSAGAVVAESRYLPYGQERWSNGAGVTDFGFTSQRREGFGLYDYNARYYSPFLGRFISPDSIVPDPTSSGGLNRYRYTRNNPLKYTDPSGHCIPGVNCPGENDEVGGIRPLEEGAGGVMLPSMAVDISPTPTPTPIPTDPNWKRLDTIFNPFPPMPKDYTEENRSRVINDRNQILQDGYGDWVGLEQKVMEACRDNYCNNPHLDEWMNDKPAIYGVAANSVTGRVADTPQAYFLNELGGDSDIQIERAHNIANYEPFWMSELMRQYPDELINAKIKFYHEVLEKDEEIYNAGTLLGDTGGGP